MLELFGLLIDVTDGIANGIQQKLERHLDLFVLRQIALPRRGGASNLSCLVFVHRLPLLSTVLYQKHAAFDPQVFDFVIVLELLLRHIFGGDQVMAIGHVGLDVKRSVKIVEAFATETETRHAARTTLRHELVQFGSFHSIESAYLYVAFVFVLAHADVGLLVVAQEHDLTVDSLEQKSVVKQLTLVPRCVGQLVEHELLYVGEHLVRGMLVDEVFVAYGLEVERGAEEADAKVQVTVVGARGLGQIWRLQA